MSKKKVFALRIDEDIYAAIERWAADEFRSTNGQLEWIINTMLRNSNRLPAAKPKTKGDIDN